MLERFSEKKILVLGAGGQVGEALKLELGSRAILVGPDILDLSKPLELRSRILSMKPEVVINAAAYTQVDQAEKEEELVSLINAHAPLEIAKACYELGASFLTYSTDYVYSGGGLKPWVEEDPVAPLNAYGRSKALGEKLLVEWAPRDFRYLILRTSWVYSYLGRNFVLTMLKLGAERAELKVVNDQIGAPTYAPDLAAASIALIEKLHDKSALSGIYNCANGGETSWFEFAQEIFSCAQRHGLALKIQKVLGIQSSEYPTPARRPLNSRLNQTKIFEKCGLKLPHWKLGLEQCIGQIVNSKGVAK